MSENKTPEQIAADVAAAKAEAKAKADAAKAEAKAKADAAKAEAKAKADAAKAELKAKKEAEAKAAADAKAAAAAKKAEEKAAAAAKAAETKVKVTQPQQNGVTRPKPDGACGKVWALADSESARLGQPVPISVLSKATTAAGLNDATTRTQYARWKTFNGLFGAVPKLPEAAPAAPAA
jgi:hypothetical protein